MLDICGLFLRNCLLLLVFLLGATPTFAGDASDAAACDTAARMAAQRFGVPEKVLLAISRVETGRRVKGQFAPWPWTINRAGAGEWHESRADAQARVEYALRNGEKNIDIGCFQLNYYWHGDAFSSLEQMFDPVDNAFYAAIFLRDLYKETGSWREAIGAYHSRLPQDSRRYIARVVSVLNKEKTEGRVSQAGPVSPPLVVGAVLGRERYSAESRERISPRVNTYPLLQSGRGMALGSLVASERDGTMKPLF